MFTGVSTASLFLREMNEDALTVLDGLGIKSTEVFLTTLSEYEEPFARLLASRRGRLFVNSVHVLNTQFEPQLFAQHPRARADAFAILHRAMSAAHIFGAERYTFHAITRLKKNSAPADCGKLAANFCEIADSCAEHGVKLCLETVYIKDMEGAISHVHLSDVDDAGHICLPGKGTFDFETCLRRLKDAGFDGALLIEVYPHDYGGYGELKQACDYLDELVYKIGG